ncbi:MAG: efflux RND transporter permease subunit, partial [Candidatus Faecivicinus sp.]
MLGKYSVKKPYTVVVGIILVLVLGVISFSNMTTDLLPSMNFPYVIVYTTYIGATPEQIEEKVTRPLESSFATLTDIKNITSQSSDNLSLVVLEFNDTADLNTAMIEINSEITMLSAGWSDSVGAPAIMKINPDMLPVSIVSVAREDMDVYELSKYVEETLIPEYESINGVASVTASGLITREVDVTIEQDRIDVLNNAILRDIDAQLADAEEQLDEAQAKISDGKSQLASQKSSVLAQLDSALSQLDSGEDQMAAAIDQLRTQRAQLQTQLDEVNAGIAQLEKLVNLSDEERAMLSMLEAQLGALKGQKELLERQLEALENGEGNAALTQERANAVERRDALAAERETLARYIEDLKAADAASIQSEIDALNGELAAAQQELSAAQAVLDEKNAARSETQAHVDALKQAIAEQESGESSPTDNPETTDAPVSTDNPETTDAPASTDNPETTDAPAATDDPETTDAPAATDDPETTDAPASTGDPGSTSNPDAAAAAVQTDALNDADALQTAEAEATAAVQPDDAGDEAGLSAQCEDEEAVPAPEDGAADAGAPGEAPAGDAAEESLLFRLFAASADGASLEELKAELAAAEETLAAQSAEAEAAQAEVDRCKDNVAAIQSRIDDKQTALDDVQSGDLTTRIQAAEREMARLDARIALIDAEIQVIDDLLTGDATAIGMARKALEEVDAKIEEIEQSEEYQALQLLTNEDELNAQYAAALEGKAQLEAGIAQIDSYLEKLEKGIIPGGMIDGIDEDTSLADARSKLSSARSQALEAFAEAEAQLAEASDQLAEARKEFEDKRDEALENAGLDGIITVDTVAALLGAQNLSMPAGYVYDINEDEYLVRVGDKFESIDELKQLKLFSIGMDSVDEVRLTDVARVEITDNADETFTKVDGHDGILLSIEKQSTFSTTDVADRVAEKSAALMREESGLSVVDLFNQGDYINIIVDSVLSNLIYGGILAVLVLLIFLMDWRPTIIVAISIPLSVVAAFVCMYFSGITLNVLSLSGLALGIGMLVDNSIVAIENIYRLRNEEHMPILHACVKGVGQVSGSLFASTLTTICVFLPVVFVTGLAHDLFVDLGLTIAFSLLASLVMALTVVPAMSASLLKKPKKAKRRSVFALIQGGYTRLLRGMLRVKPLVLLAAVALLAFTVMQVPRMGTSFMPQVNSTQMTATLALDPEEDLEPQQERALELMNRMLEVDGIQTVGLNSGGGMKSMLGGSSSLTYYMIVDEDAGRDNVDIAADIRTVSEDMGVELSISTSTMDISMLTGSGISVDITGPEIDGLQSVARDVAEIVRGLDGAAEIDDGLEASVPEIRITVDKELATDHNLTVGQVYQFIAKKLYGKMEITQASLDGETLSIYLIDGRNASITPDMLADLEMEVTSGDKSEMVRIGDIATVADSESFSTIKRENQQRTLSVSFQIAEGYSANHVSDALEEKLADYQPPEGYTVALSGENETVTSIMEDLVFMVAVAVLMIFLIMVAQFQSFKSPIIVLFTIPLAFTGGLLALLITDMDLSIVAMVGFLVLSGVVVNNGIVFVDTVNQLRIGGMSKKDALIETGRLRLRPILMTAATTILGMSTMALGAGLGAEMMQPMAVVTIGGLTYATLMTLFIVPVLYDLINGEKMSAREIQMAREAAGMANGDEIFDESKNAPDGAAALSEAAPAQSGAGAQAHAEASGDATGSAPAAEESAGEKRPKAAPAAEQPMPLAQPAGNPMAGASAETPVSPAQPAGNPQYVCGAPGQAGNAPVPPQYPYAPYPYMPYPYGYGYGISGPVPQPAGQPSGYPAGMPYPYGYPAPQPAVQPMMQTAAPESAPVPQQPGLASESAAASPQPEAAPGSAPAADEREEA